MNPPDFPATPTAGDRSRPQVARLGLARLGRLTLKELRETLRDRRTIVTLVLMPLLVYPLLSFAFRQFLVSSVQPAPTRVRIGVVSDEQRVFLTELLAAGDQLLAEQREQPGQAAPPQPRFTPADEPSGVSSDQFDYFTTSKPGQPIQDLSVDLAVRMEPRSGGLDGALRGVPFRLDMWYHPDSPLSREAAAFVEERLRVVNERFVQTQLSQPEQSSLASQLPAAWRFVPLAAPERRSFWLASLVPLVLIIMTITGAVYPAIDLTAGERERGTLEALMAAPVPRLGLLIAKYIAVVTVAMLTAVMNLLAMTITVATSGLGPALFGERGLPLSSVAIVFALLVLFASFFSAVLLTITSFARSFKEAQAYLIPLMLISLAPGFLSVVPDVELNALLSITPLANIVLLARDVLEGDAPPLWAAVAVLSTLLYGALALSLAARIFGSDAILYGSEGSWGDLLRRPEQPRAQATIAGALAALAVVTPLYILLGGLPAWFPGISMLTQLTLAGLLNVSIFFAVPLLLAKWQGVSVGSAFQLRTAKWLSFVGAVVLGCSLAPLAYELIIASRELGIATLSDAKLREFMESLAKIVNQWRGLHPLAILVPLAIVPAICEEWFFRGYLLGALRGRAPAWFAIGATALVFGVFHASLGGVIMVERVLSSAALGIVLGWVCWTSRSVLPGMCLHALNNGLLLSLAYWGDGLKTLLGPEFDDQHHLPALWVAAAAALSLVGIALVYLGRCSDAPETLLLKPPLAAPLPAPVETNPS